MFIVSIIGRPNVGKSSLFNRIIGKRVAVVDGMPGVTRDRHYHDASWNGCSFVLIDTGGLEHATEEGMAREIDKQVMIACEESDVILFLVEAVVGPTNLDGLIAKRLRKHDKNKVVLVINKAESKQAAFELGAFYSLGFGPGFAVSSLHGKGVGDLLDHVCGLLRKVKKPAVTTIDTDGCLKIAIVGRPNSGKSSLLNRLVKKERMIVSAAPGTTRDSIDTEIDHNGTPVVLIDTAGLRKKARVDGDVEYYCNIRALESVKRSDLCLLLVDAADGIQEQDLRIVKHIQANRKGFVLCWNKWDLVEKNHMTFDHLAARTRKTYRELRHVPMLSISALTGQRTAQVLDVALSVYARMTARVPLDGLRAKVREWTTLHPHPVTANEALRIVSCDQFAAQYPVFRFFAKNARNARASYKRYLENKIYENYEFDGCPVVIEFHNPRRP
ncbi:MAG: ribosome biogenesis GTPase Der [Chitinivibrionales bacterium]